MTSITEDPSLPLDLDGTSNQLSNSSHFGNHDMTDQDITSSISSEIEHPGTFPNLTSAGKMSPHRTRTMKDQETQLGELKKENFGLKLRIYHLEEALRKKWGDSGDGWKMNIELQVQMANLKKETADKDALLMKAKSAIDQMAAQHDAHIKEMQRELDASTQTKEIEALKRSLAEHANDLEEASKEIEEANQRMRDMQDLNERLEDELRNKDRELGKMDQELEDLQRALEEREATDAPPPSVPTFTRACQTTEPMAAKLAEATGALEEAKSKLDEQEKETAALKATMADKDKRIKELEIELLSASQKLAAGADDHSREMQNQASDLDRSNARVRDLEDKARQLEDELQRSRGECEGARQQAREAETLVQRLQPLVQGRDREIQDLQGRLRDAESNDRDKDAEIRDLGRRLKEAESRAGRSQPELADKQREIDRLSRDLDDRDEELSRLRSKLKETEEALSHARKSAHKAGVDNREQNEALRKLQEELEALRDQLRRQRDGIQTDLEAGLVAKDAMIEQMKRELEDLRSKLDQAEQTILHLTTSKAAELGVMRATIDDLNRQIEHLERMNRDLRNEVGQLAGEKASLEREMEKLRSENRALRDQIAALQNELAEKKRNLSQAEQALADLQKLINDLHQQEHKQTGASDAELARLRSLLASLEHTLRNREAEVDSLMTTISLKDDQIADLTDQLARVMADKANLEEKVRELRNENNRLENELAKLRSQARISKLASDDLQSKLTQAFGEREELIRKLQLAEEALRDKEAANDRFQSMCDSLREQIKHLQRQLEELSHRTPPHTVSVTTHETTTTHESTDGPGGKAGEAKGANSTTMIFGSPSESLLLTILQKLQDLYGEITAGRADTNVATSSLSSKLEQITELQRHLEDSMHDKQPQKEPTSSQPNSNNTSYTAYYFMRGEDEEESSSEDKPIVRESSTPKKASPRSEPTGLSATTAALRDSTAQVEALQAELDEVKQWNDELQTRLNETEGELRDKDGERVKPKHPVNYQELEKEVDRLLAELDAEREQSQTERAQQQQEFDVLQDQLKNTEDKVRDLERQLRLAMARDAGTSTDPETVDTLQQEIDRLVSEVDEARATIAALRGRLDAEKNENQQLRSEVSDLRFTKDSPLKSDSEASSSMPNLLTKNVSDSWTSPARTSQSMAEQPDVRALKQKHEEVTRLNQELQRKCREQLYRSPPHSRPTSASHTTTIHWQSKLREQEESLRAEMLERERGLLKQIRETESRLVERETEWKQLEMALKHQIIDLESRLSEALESGDLIRKKHAEVVAGSRAKDEEIVNLSRSLSQSQEKTNALEEQLDVLLTEKNTVITDLEERIHVLEDELMKSHEKEASMRQTGGDEVTTLHETIDSLTQQLTTRNEDVEELQRKNHNHDSQRSILNSQLASAQEQIRVLKEELTLYQKILDSKDSGGAQAPGGSDISLSVEKIIQLLEEIRKLREQLDQSIRSNNALAEQLQSRLDQTHTETTLHHTSQTSPRRTQGNQTTPQRRESGRQTFTQGTSPPRVRLSTRATSTHIPTSERSTGTKGQSSTKTEHTSVYFHHDSDTTTPPSFSETHLSDASTSSLHPPPSTTHKSTANVSTSTPFSPPKDSSTPHARSRHSDPLSRSSTHRTSVRDRSSTNYTDSGVNTEGQSRSGDDGHQKEPHTSSSSHYTRTKTTTTTRRHPDLSGGGSDASGGSPRGRRKPTSANRGSGEDVRTTTFTLSGAGDFDSLETRLQQALNSPSLLAADRSFLEDLLIYLRQQRKQLDESRKLLERLEESSGIPSTSHIHVDTADSATLPTTPLHTSTQTHSQTHTAGSQATPRGVYTSHSTAQTTSHNGDETTPPRAQTTPLETGRNTHSTGTYSYHSETTKIPRTGGASFSETSYVGPTRVTKVTNGDASEGGVRGEAGARSEAGAGRGRASRVDLSKLYEQLLQTHSSLAEARSALNHQRKQ